MTLHEFNTAGFDAAHAALLRCCGSTQWAKKMSAFRPFPDAESLLSQADSVWWMLAPTDWLEAFSAHPRIGAQKLAGWSSQEQSGIDSSQVHILQQLAKGNQDYQQRFGWIFLINATGKSALDMLAVLHSRLMNESPEELRIAASEQSQITRLRLQKLFEQ